MIFGYLKNIFKEEVVDIYVPRSASLILREILELSKQDIRVAFEDGYGWNRAIAQIEEFQSKEDRNVSETIYLPGNRHGMYRVILRRDEENRKKSIVKHVDILPEGAEKEFRIKIID